MLDRLGHMGYVRWSKGHGNDEETHTDRGEHPPSPIPTEKATDIDDTDDDAVIDFN